VARGGGGGARGPSSVLSSLVTAVAVGANVDRAPLQLNALFLQNAFSTQGDLVGRIARHYSFQVISQLYHYSRLVRHHRQSRVAGQHARHGRVRLLLRAGATRSCARRATLASASMKGTSSLVKHTVYGLFDTASKITGSVGMGAAYLSGDHRYVRERGRRVAQRANNVGEGFYLGMRELGSGLLNGVRGVFVQPFVDARRDGAAGLLRGVAARASSARRSSRRSA
jgi:vacuolar protein sorting-associated protein 13A/C